MNATNKTNRRGFIASGAIAGAAPLLAAATASGTAAEAPAAPAGKLPRLGLVTYNLAKDWDVDTIIANCAKTGFEGVELRTTHAHKVEVALSADQRREVRKKFADSPVTLMGLGSAFDFHTPDATKLRADIEATKAYIQLAADVGATGVKVRPNGLPPNVPEEKTLNQIGDSLRELGEFAANLGLVIRLEIHGEATSRVPRIRKILDRAAHRSVGACWNSNQTDLLDGGFDANFDLVKDRVFSVHLRDLYLEEYPFHRLFTRLREIGFAGFAMAEIPESGDPLRVMRYFRGLWLAFQNRL
jgi:sugar phosphate isomerase/epimerase